MIMRSKRRILATAFAVSIGAVSVACSALLDTKSDQCATNGDCAHFSATAVCQSGVCVEADISNGADGAVADGSSVPGTDAGMDGTVTPVTDAGEAGCTPKVPTTQTDYLNEKCTTSVCFPFDNCARLGVCDGSLPPTLTPDGGL
jgi:hypothetical protein